MARRFQLTVNGVVYQVEVGDLAQNPVQVVVNGQPYLVQVMEVLEEQAKGPETTTAPVQPAQPAPQPSPTATVGAGFITAPMPGVILAVQVQVGERVSYGQEVCVLEAMKMEQSIRSTVEGVVRAVRVSVGDNVAYNDVLVEIQEG